MERDDGGAATADAGSGAQVDRVALEEFIEAGGVALLDALAEAAAADAAAQFASLESLSHGPCAGAAEHALHTLKGTGASLGLVGFAAEAERLLDRARHGQLPEVAACEALAGRWAADFDAFRTLCEAYRDADA